MSRPEIEPGPPAWEASTLEKSHLDSLSAGYSEPLLRRHLLTTFGPLQENDSYCQKSKFLPFAKCLKTYNFFKHMRSKFAKCANKTPTFFSSPN